MHKIESEQNTFRRLVLAITVLILMLVLSFCSLLTYRKKLDETLYGINKRNLERYSDQGTLLFNTMIQDYFRQLDMIARFCSVNTGIHDDKIVELLKSCNDDKSYVCFGVSGTNGRLYVGNGTQIDISEQDFFKKALDNEFYISDVVKSESTGRDVLVFSVWIKKGEELAGIACAQYDVQYFTDLLGSSQFKGTGATMVMQKDGRIVSGYAGIEDFDTLYEALEQMDFKGTDTLESLRQRIEAEESGFFTYYKDNNARYLYFAPAGIRDYVMISLVMAETMDRDAREISMQALILTVKNIIFYCIILFCVWALFTQIRNLVHYYQRDPLTRVDNKVSARKEIDRFLNRAGKKKQHSFFFMDIDNFKQINDQYGHEKGDQVLIEFSSILRQNFRPSDIICRYGGDEFLVFIREIPSVQMAEKKAIRLAEILANRQGEIPFTISIGIACYPKDGENFKALLNRADEALYLAKKGGKNKYCICSQETDGLEFQREKEEKGKAQG